MIYNKKRGTVRRSSFFYPKKIMNFFIENYELFSYKKGEFLALPFFIFLSAFRGTLAESPFVRETRESKQIHSAPLRSSLLSLRGNYRRTRAVQV